MILEVLAGIGILYAMNKKVKAAAVTEPANTAAAEKSAPVNAVKFKSWTYKNIAALAQKEGFTVTSTTGGKHNVGSKHGKGKAIDVRTRDKTTTAVNAFIAKMRSLGLIVHDERVRPPNQKVWGGAHVHIELP